MSPRIHTVAARTFAMVAPSASAPAWWRPFLLGLFVMALGWRLLALQRLAGGPLLNYLSADGDAYWAWAGRIRSGSWAGSQPFFLGPLYAYALAAGRYLVGDSIAGALTFQCVLGSAAIVLLTDITRRLASARAAVWVGVALAGYSMLVLFDCMILMESLLFLLGSLWLWCCVRSPGARWLPAAAGLLIGAMALGRPTMLLLLLPLGGLFVALRPRRLALLAVGEAGLVLALVSLPAVLHHRRAVREWIPFTYSLGLNFYMGNGPEANGTYVLFTGSHEPQPLNGDAVEGGTAGDGRSYLLETRRLSLSASESSRYWLRAALAQMQSHPLAAARLLALKSALLLNHRELPQIELPTAYERAAGTLGWPLALEFGFFGVFGLLGIVWAWPKGPRHRLVVSSFVVIWLGTATFFVVDRYRIHLLVFLAPLAGLALERAIEAWRTREVGWWGRSLVAGAAASAIVFAPLVPHRAALEEWSIAGTFGDAWLSSHRPDRALPFLERAVALDRAGRLPNIDTPSTRGLRASAFEDLGNAQAWLGDDSSALASYRDALALGPYSVTLRCRYADQLAMAGRFAESIREYEQVGLTETQVAERLVSGATQDQARGDTVHVRKRLLAAIALAPGYEPAAIPLARLEIQRRGFAVAMQLLRDARDAGLDPFVYRAHLAWIRSAEGDTAGGRRLVASIPAALRERDPRVAGTLALGRLTSGP